MEFKNKGGTMQNAAPQNEHVRPLLEYGYVKAVNRHDVTVLTSYGEMISERAVSCLIQPETGDTVLLSVDMSGDSFILSVLRRDATTTAKTDLLFDGEVNLHVSSGGLSLTADKGITVGTRETVTCVGRKVSVHADEGEATIQNCSFLGTFLHVQAERIKHVADIADSIYRRWTQRLETAFRFVKEEEEVQTGSTRYLVEDTLTMHSKNAVHMSEEIVTINAEQVHLG